MEYGRVEGIVLPVSRLVQGTMMIGTDKLDYVFELLDGVYAQGCNTFDTAHIYCGGEAERALGRWVTARGLREKVVILTKGAHHNQDRKRVTPYDIMSDLQDSLARLGTDYVDIYLLHRDNPDVPVSEIVDALNEQKAAGRIRAFGGSNWSHERIAAANAYASAKGLTPFAASSPQFSLAAPKEEIWEGCASLGGVEATAARKWYAETQLPVFCWSSLARGFLSGAFSAEQLGAMQETGEAMIRCFRSPDNLARLQRASALAAEQGASLPQVALAWVLRQTLNTFALVGCQTPKEFEMNVGAFNINLTPEDAASLLG